jgi:hypothetical protein
VPSVTSSFGATSPPSMIPTYTLAERRPACHSRAALSVSTRARLKPSGRPFVRCELCVVWCSLRVIARIDARIAVSMRALEDFLEADQHVAIKLEMEAKQAHHPQRNPTRPTAATMPLPSASQTLCGVATNRLRRRALGGGMSVARRCDTTRRISLRRSLTSSLRRARRRSHALACLKCAAACVGVIGTVIPSLTLSAPLFARSAMCPRPPKRLC